MNKIFKHILAIGITCIGIFNLTNAGNYTYTGHYDHTLNSFNNGTNLTITNLPLPIEKFGINHDFTVNCTISNLNNDFGIDPRRYNANGVYYNCNEGYNCTNYNNSKLINYVSNSFSYNYTGQNYNGFWFGINWNLPSNMSNQNVTLDWSCTFSGDNIIDQNSGGASCDTGAILSGYVLESTINTGYCTGNNLCPTCQACNQYSSLECQTEYNLIPIADVTANYCKLNFDLISPTDCPGIGEGTGDINRTAWYINNTQYPGTDTLYINIPDDIAWNTTYNTSETIVDVEGYNADEDYIENIISQTELAPTNQDFEYLMTHLGDYLPIIMVAILFILAWNILKRVFK